MRIKTSAVMLLVALAASIGNFAFAEENLTNVALGKNITAGNYSRQYPKENLTDGNSATYVNEQGTLTDNENGIPSDYTKGENRYVIDLGAIYKVNSVKLFDDAKNWYSEYDFKISASTDKNFGESVTLFKTDDFTPQSLPLEVSCNNEYYRYICLERINSGMGLGYTYSELEVWADENDKIEPEEEAEPVNIALGKRVTAGVWDANLPKANINDGKISTFTYPGGTNTDNADGIASSSAEAWYVFDLGARYRIDYVKLIDNTNTWTSGYNVKILASNDKNFENEVYEIINSGQDAGIPMGENITCGSDEYFRYVKIQKFPGSASETTWGYQYSEFEVYSANELLIDVKAETEANKIVFTFDREVSFNNVSETAVTLKSSGEKLPYKFEMPSENTLVFTFNREIYSDEANIVFPEDFSNDIKLKTYEINAKFKDVICTENVMFVNENGDEITKMTGGEKRRAKIILRNNSLNTAGSCMVLTLTFNGKKLVGAAENRINLEAGESCEIETALQDADGDRYRVWVFRDYKRMSEIYKGEITK